MKFKKYSTIIWLAVFALFLFAPVVHVRANDYWPIVPCGLQQQPAGATLKDTNGKIHDYTQTCNQCLLILLFNNLINLTFFWIVPVVGTFFILLGGFFILVGGGTGNQKWVGTGYAIFRSTLIGAAIILSSWVITNFILKSFTGNPNGTVSGAPWYQIQCSTGTLAQAVSATAPASGNTGTPGATVGYDCGDNSECIVDTTSDATYQGSTALSDCQERCQGITPTTGSVGYDCNDNSQCVVDTNPSTQEYQDLSSCQSICQGITPGGGATSGGSDTSGVQCPDSNINRGTNGAGICQASTTSTTCGTSSCSQYDASINAYATGGATVSLLKAIMYTESSCNPTKSNAAGQSYGLMELQVPTAVAHAQGCVSNTSVITPAWLTDPDNSDAIICIAANYINSLVSTCGNNVANLAANYNGANACNPSADCTTGSICGDSPPKAWECLYDNTAQTVCNTGFSETRKYVPNILYCVNNNNPGFQ